jgi:cyclopropane fatty-acyl-phospholipid synthase-like methyltransferase
MSADQKPVSERFPRSSRYHPEWITANASGGANALWLTEWLTTELDLKPGMRVLDLGCGRAASSIFLRREFDVQVWATDLWFSASENIQRIRDAGVEDGVFPLHADARSLPFAADFFDAIICIDAFSYFGTDDLYLNYLAHFLKPGGLVGIAGAGLAQEIEGPVPNHLREFWSQDFWCLHSAALEADRGKYLAYVRVVGRRRGDVKLEDYCWPDTMRSAPQQYTKKPLLRGQS